MSTESETTIEPDGPNKHKLVDTKTGEVIKSGTWKEMYELRKTLKKPSRADQLSNTKGAVG